MCVKIDDKILNKVTLEAQTNPRGRKHYNFHKDYGETVQRLINAIEPGSYIRPHTHVNPDKLEIFMVLRGCFVVLIFDDSGSIKEHYVLDSNTGKYGIEIQPGTIHMIASLESGSVAYEIKNGPFDPSTDKNFADWAPEEGSPESKSYLDNLLKQVNI